MNVDCLVNFDRTGNGACTVRSARLTVAVLLIACFTGGCALQPWIKPYERERLVDPVMQPRDDALSDRHFEHVRATREGARGATHARGGACGCN